MKLLIAVVQHEDAVKAKSALVESGYRVTELHSTGGLLSRHNSTLLCGVEADQVDAAIEVLSNVCVGRTINLEHGHPLFAVHDKVHLGGAVVFVVDLERFVRI
ncbi:MAG: cyclic-di-AMP receptor [Bacillota bacterium]|nr:cyclic-di-AMP receptor [Bacillota bacterium]